MTTATALADRKLPSLRVELAAGVTFAQDDDTAGLIAGTAAAYNIEVDRGYGMFLELLPGCFAKQVAEAHRVKLLWQHDVEEPIGVVKSLSDSPQRLEFVGRLSTSNAVPTAVKARELYADGILDEVSVGFEILKFERVEDLENDRVLYRVREAHLREISTVTFGALGQSAAVSAVHSQGSADVRILEARRLLGEVSRLLA